MRSNRPSKRTTRIAVVVLAGVPTLAVEWWWKRRTRRQSEHLLISGSDAVLARDRNGGR